MRTMQEILAELKPLMGSNDATDRAKFNALEDELKQLQLTEEDKKNGQVFFIDGINEIKNDINRIEKEISIKNQLKEVSEIVSLSYIAKKYFNKTRTWLYQKINNNTINGKPARLSQEELNTLQFALNDISKKIGSLHLSLD